MDRKSRKGLLNICCRTTASCDSKFTDAYLKASKSHKDETLLEKMQANAEVRRIEMLNGKLTRNLAELREKLAETEEKIFRFDSKYNIDTKGNGSFATTIYGIDSSLENNKEDYAPIEPCLTSKESLTSKKTPGIEFRKYLIHEGHGTPSGVSSPHIDDRNEIKTTHEVVKDIDLEKTHDTNNNSKPFVVIQTVPMT